MHMDSFIIHMHSYIHIISHLHMRVIIWMLRIWRFSVFSIFSRTNSKRSRKKAIDINLCKNVEIASTVVSPVAAAVNLQFWFFLHCFVFFFFWRQHNAPFDVVQHEPHGFRKFWQSIKLRAEIFTRTAI